MSPKAIDGISQAIELMVFYSLALVCIFIVGIIVACISKSPSGKATGYFMVFIPIIIALSMVFGS